MGKIDKKNFNNNKSSGKISQAKKKSLEDYVFYIGTKQASDFEVTQEFVLNCMFLTNSSVQLNFHQNYQMFKENKLLHLKLFYPTKSRKTKPFKLKCV